ncbi:MAG: hypothetical protein DRP45_02005 [Candidatus Zixiibacteriota bacterium]|nr:MAG: hypothetical protein DRP45_02005 [candidate division Zixibacteria bacterium]
MKISIAKCEKGISILEVLVAMIILSLALLMLLNMGIVALDSNRWSDRTTVATQLLQEKMEEIRASGNFTSGSDTAGSDIVRSWTVNDAGNHLREVIVNVAWLDLRANEHVNSITAYVRTDSI